MANRVCGIDEFFCLERAVVFAIKRFDLIDGASTIEEK
jgi:hypothetical protein